MKVGFYFGIGIAGKDGLDCSNITQGNPGMGGTGYELLIVSYLLQQRDNGIEPVLFTRSNLITPHKHVIPVRGGQSADTLRLVRRERCGAACHQPTRV